MQLFENLLLLKSLHIIAVVSWFAGLFYLPRLFIYHLKNKNNAGIYKTFMTMEKRLYKYIMMPSMVFTLVFGLLLVWFNPSYMSGSWFHIKMILVAILISFHYFCGCYLKQFALGKFNKTEKYLRLFNEVPTIVLIMVVFLVVFKP